MMVYIMDPNRRVVTPLRVDNRVKQVEQLAPIEGPHRIAITGQPSEVESYVETEFEVAEKPESWLGNIVRERNEKQERQHQDTDEATQPSKDHLAPHSEVPQTELTQLNIASQFELKRASEIMSAPILYGQANWSVEYALQYMNEHAIHHMPVTDGEDVIGLIDQKDLYQALQNESVPSSIMDLCTPFVVMDGDHNITRVALVMLRQGVDAVLIRNASGQATGVLTQRDILTAIADIQVEDWA